jgi:hypothetical protein
VVAKLGAYLSYLLQLSLRGLIGAEENYPLSVA